MKYHSLTKKQLIELCKKSNITGYSRKNKEEVITLIKIFNKRKKEEEEIKQQITNPNYLTNLLNEVLKTYKLCEVAKLLNITSSTIRRWIELNNIPQNYEFDLLKLLNIEIDYSKYDSRLKDQFYTPVSTAQKCFDIFCRKIQKYGDNENNYTFIEPSAGDGRFLKVLPKNTIALDIEPKHKKIIKADYLE